MVELQSKACITPWLAGQGGETCEVSLSPISGLEIMQTVKLRWNASWLDHVRTQVLVLWTVRTNMIISGSQQEAGFEISVMSHKSNEQFLCWAFPWFVEEDWRIFNKVYWSIDYRELEWVDCIKYINVCQPATSLITSHCLPVIIIQ